MSWSLILMLTPIALIVMIWAIIKIWAKIEKKRFHRELYEDSDDNSRMSDMP